MTGEENGATGTRITYTRDGETVEGTVIEVKGKRLGKGGSDRGYVKAERDDGTVDTVGEGKFDIA
jgi:hypothetical protein